MEVDYLVSKLNECKYPYTCPHGRPTIIRMSVKELEEMFDRIQK
jgi:DNA mismatch repair protein MutL